jgi:hypothetical protein
MDAILTDLLQPVIAILGAALATLITSLLVQLVQRFGIQLDLERQALLEAAARKAVLMVEEQAANALKRGLSEWTGPQKMTAAVTDIVDHIPRVDRAEAERIVQAVLPALGLGATELGNALRTR